MVSGALASMCTSQCPISSAVPIGAQSCGRDDDAGDDARDDSARPVLCARLGGRPL